MGVVDIIRCLRLAEMPEQHPDSPRKCKTPPVSLLLRAGRRFDSRSTMSLRVVFTIHACTYADRHAGFGMIKRATHARLLCMMMMTDDGRTKCCQYVAVSFCTAERVHGELMMSLRAKCFPSLSTALFSVVLNIAAYRAYYS